MNEATEEADLAKITAMAIDSLRYGQPSHRAVQEWDEIHGPGGSAERQRRLDAGALAVVEDPSGLLELKAAVEACLSAAALNTAEAHDTKGLSCLLGGVLLPWIEFAERSRLAHDGWTTGKLLPPEELCLRQLAGSGRDVESGKAYTLSVMPGGMPHVVSAQSNRQWVASWDDLVRLARAAGVDLPQRYEPVTSIPEHVLAKGLGVELPPIGLPLHPKSQPAQLAPAEGLTLSPGPAVAGIGAGAPPEPSSGDRPLGEPEPSSGDGAPGEPHHTSGSQGGAL